MGIRLVLTGPANSGKTTLAQKLANNYDFLVVPESAIKIISLYDEIYGKNDSANIRKENNLSMQTAVLCHAYAMDHIYHNYTGNLVYDRTYLDAFSYMELRNATIDFTFPPVSEYDIVFYVPALDVFSPRNETGRIDTADENDAIGSILKHI